MEFFSTKSSYPFMGKRKLWYAISALLILISLGSLAVRGLNFGIDFTGGVALELSFPQAANLEKVRSELAAAGFESAAVQSFGTPRDVIAKLNAAVATLLNNREFVDQQLVTQGMVPMNMTPDKVTALIRTETERMGRIVKLSGATVE